jgi:hypothetical protein
MADGLNPVPVDCYLAEMGLDAYNVIRTLLGDSISELIPAAPQKQTHLSFSQEH